VGGYHREVGRVLKRYLESGLAAALVDRKASRYPV
jgi:hypothetical protein